MCMRAWSVVAREREKERERERYESTLSLPLYA